LLSLPGQEISSVTDEGGAAHFLDSQSSDDTSTIRKWVLTSTLVHLAPGEIVHTAIGRYWSWNGAEILTGVEPGNLLPAASASIEHSEQVLFGHNLNSQTAEANRT
jgi:hypothetical protein